MTIIKQICRSFKQSFILSAVLTGGIGICASVLVDKDAMAASSQAGVTIDLVEFEKAGKFSSLAKVKVSLKDDPAYHRPVTLEGYRLEDILTFLPGLEQKKNGRYEVRFIAADGYEVSAPLRSLTEGKGIVAFRDTSLPAAQKWATFPFGKGQITPAPFYLVWEGISYTNKKFPWPWQLAKIQLASFDELYGAAFPKSADAHVRKGFEVFRQHCISCHSINLAGGSAGMEMNVPKSITEYWNQEHFAQFVRNPESYRARAKMTPKEHLTSEEMGLLWTYLKAMGNEKICSDIDSCKKVK